VDDKLTGSTGRPIAIEHLLSIKKEDKHSTIIMQTKHGTGH